MKLKKQSFFITNPIIALITMSCFALFHGAVGTYVGAMITTIEKRFNLSTAQLGLLMGANDIGYLTTVVIITYLGSRKSRQPIMMCISGIGLWLSCTIYTSPYWIFGSRFDPRLLLSINETKTDFCTIKSNITRHLIDKSDVSPTEKHTTIFLMMIAGIINGIAATPFWNLGISFIDDMVGEKSGIYIGFLFAVRSFSPIVGFLFGSYMTTVHESLQINLKQFLPGQKDPKWIGAWWFGWLILGFLVLFISPFLGLLRIKKKKERVKSDEVQESIQMIDSYEKKIQNDRVENRIEGEDLPAIKEIIIILKEAFQNRIYVLLVTGLVFDILGNMCIYMFFTKYLEFHFRASAKITNILTAFCLAGSRLFSSLISGLISRVVPMSIRQMNCFIALSNTIPLIFFPLLIIFSCDNVVVHGLPQFERNNPIINCSQSCDCKFNKMDPICFNGSTYFTPCTAVCTEKINQTFFGRCGCDRNLFATTGYCEQMCKSIHLFLIVFFVYKVVNSICSVQFFTVLMRLGNPKNKAVYISFIGFIFGIFGLSFPPAAGWVIDRACIYRNTDSYGGKSNCLIYNNDLLRYLIFGFSLLFQIPACGLYMWTWRITPHKYRWVANEDDIKELNDDTNGQRNNKKENNYFIG